MTEKCLNRVLVSGLIRDARLSSTPTGKSVCNFILIISDPRVSGEGESKMYLPVSAWQGLAKRTAEFQVNQKVRISGRLRVSSWDDKAGSKRYKTEIICDSIEPVARLDLPPDQGAIDRRPISDEDIPF